MKRTARATLAIALTLGAAVHAQDNGIPRLFVDVAPQTPKAEVAILLVNQPQPRGRDFKCAVNHLSPARPNGAKDWTRQATGKLPHGGAYVAIKPGPYDIAVLYQTHLREGNEWGKATFGAGKTYAVNCVGRTFNQLKVRAVEIEP
ncbi:MAG: hypothetical protein ACOY82_14685 [Pseudomonadota bacterium]